MHGIRISLSPELRPLLVWMLGHVLIVCLLIQAVGLLEGGLNQIPLLLWRQTHLGLNDAPALVRDKVCRRVVLHSQSTVIALMILP